MIELWTDGACAKRGQKIGGWAFVALLDGKPLIEMGNWQRPATSDEMELLAALKAIRWQKKNHPTQAATLTTDSHYVFNRLRHRGDHLYDPRHEHVRLASLWRDLEELLGTDVRPTIEMVRGHSGVEWNERADHLAKQAQSSGTIFRSYSPRK